MGLCSCINLQTQIMLSDPINQPSAVNQCVTNYKSLFGKETTPIIYDYGTMTQNQLYSGLNAAFANKFNVELFSKIPSCVLPVPGVLPSNLLVLFLDFSDDPKERFFLDSGLIRVASSFTTNVNTTVIGVVVARK